MKDGILYSICWEDHELIAELIGQGDRVLLVTSAGDTALSALTKHPHSVDTVDTNLDQLKLSRLKWSAVETLEPKEFQEFMGCFCLPKKDGNGRKLLDRLKSEISPDLEVWLGLHVDGLQQGVMHVGKFDRYLQTFSKYLLPIAISQKVRTRFLKAENLQEQREIYDKHINNWRYRLLFKWFFGRFYMKRKGRHPDLLKHVQEDPSKVFFNRMQHAWTEVPIQENYFLRLILQHRWDRGLRYPKWLEVASLESIKPQVSNIQSHLQDALIYLEEKAVGHYDLIYLSDITETMTKERAHCLFEECRTKLSPNGRLVIWNNLVDRKPSIGWKLDEALSEKLWRERKVSFYGFLGIYSPS